MPLEDSGAYGDRPAWPAEPAPEPSPHAAGLDWLAAESTNLVVVIEQACDHGLVEEAWGLARALHPYYDTGRRDDELTQTSTALRTAAGRAGHAAAEACALIGLAGAAANRGDLEDCYGLHAIASELSDRSGLTRSMVVSSHQMASVLRLSGRLAEAGRVSQESMRRASALGDRDLVIACACESSPVAVASGDPASALRLLCTVAGGLASLPATRRSAIVALRFAQAHRALGEIDAAREYLDFALDLVKVLGDKVGQGYIQLELGHLAHAAGALALAEARFREARLALAAADRPTGEAKALGALARVQTQRGLPDTASRAPHEALAAIEGIQAGNLVTELHRELLLLTL
jgi:tetratricopeptide (TPR) repeat protein